MLHCLNHAVVVNRLPCLNKVVGHIKFLKTTWPVLLVLLLKEGKMQEAEVVAQKNYEKSKKRKRLLEKSNCDAEMCLIFPIDEECGWDDHFECKNGCKLHIRCEGLAPINKGGHLPHDYQCRSCATELGNERWLEKQLEEELSKLSYSIHENSEGLRRLSMKIDYLENQVS